MRNARRYLGPALFGVVLALALHYIQSQTPIQIFGGLGWDGVNYFRIAEQVKESRPLTGPKPYLLRIAVPWLAAKTFPKNILEGFRILSLGSGFLVLVVLALILLQFQISAEIIGLVLILAVTNPWGPIRFASYYPVLPDESTLLVMGLFLYVARPGRYIVMSLIALAGALIREVTLIVPISFFIAQALEPKRPLRRLALEALPVLGMVPVLLLCRKMGISNAAAAHLFQIAPRVNFAVSVLSDPVKLLLGFVNGYGPIFFVAIGELFFHFRTWWGERRIYVILLVMVFLVSLAGGSDYERFSLWAYPTLYLAAAFGIARLWQDLQFAPYLRGSFFTVLFCAQFLAQRVGSEIPQDVREMSRVSFTLFSNYGRRVRLLDCWAAYMPPSQRNLIFIQYMVLFIAGLLVGRHVKHDSSTIRKRIRRCPIEWLFRKRIHLENRR
jgi:hypothetical protein